MNMTERVLKKEINQVGIKITLLCKIVNIFVMHDKVLATDITKSEGGETGHGCWRRRILLSTLCVSSLQCGAASVATVSR